MIIIVITATFEHYNGWTGLVSEILFQLLPPKKQKREQGFLFLIPLCQECQKFKKGEWLEDKAKINSNNI